MESRVEAVAVMGGSGKKAAEGETIQETRPLPADAEGEVQARVQGWLFVIPLSPKLEHARTQTSFKSFTTIVCTHSKVRLRPSQSAFAPFSKV